MLSFSIIQVPTFSGRPRPVSIDFRAPSHPTAPRRSSPTATERNDGTCRRISRTKDGSRLRPRLLLRLDRQVHRRRVRPVPPIGPRTHGLPMQVPSRPGQSPTSPFESIGFDSRAVVGGLVSGRGRGTRGRARSFWSLLFGPLSTGRNRDQVSSSV